LLDQLLVRGLLSEQGDLQYKKQCCCCCTSAATLIVLNMMDNSRCSGCQANGDIIPLLQDGGYSTARVFPKPFMGMSTADDCPDEPLAKMIKTVSI